MLDSLLRRQFSSFVALPAARLSTRVSANALTVGAFVAGAAALPAIGFRKYLVALGLLAVARALDGLDGPVARARGTSPFGCYLDQVLDLIITAAVPFAFALAEPERALAAMFLMLGLVARAAAAASLPGPMVGLPEQNSLIGKTELFVAFALACILPDRFNLIAYVAGVISFLAAGQRMAAVASS
jgi:phosphatidylglycerophosphate synthase